jgi:DNA-binding MarR family transcriptional regulator
MAYQLAMEGFPLPVIRAQLGHVDLSQTSHYIDHLAPIALVSALRAREWPEQLLPPAPTSLPAVISQGEARAPGPNPRISARVLVGEPDGPVAAPVRHGAASRVKTGQRVLDLLAARGGRATQAELTRALGVTKGRTSQLMAALEAEGLVISGGYHRSPGQRGPGSRLWRLAPPKARFTCDAELHDPRERAGGQVARRGYGPQRVLDVIAGFGGRGCQAQIARELGIGATTVAHHCQSLERAGKLTRGGLDKSTSNRGSQIWRLAPVRLTPSPPGWRQMTFIVGGSTPRPRRLA